MTGLEPKLFDWGVLLSESSRHEQLQRGRPHGELQIGNLVFHSNTPYQTQTLSVHVRGHSCSEIGTGRAFDRSCFLRLAKVLLHVFELPTFGAKRARRKPSFHFSSCTKHFQTEGRLEWLCVVSTALVHATLADPSRTSRRRVATTTAAASSGQHSSACRLWFGCLRSCGRNAGGVRGASQKGHP